MDWSTPFQAALTYDAFLNRYATGHLRSRWDSMHARTWLTDEQKQLLSSFVRRMPVLCMAGAWCGDCVNQCPILDHFAQATPAIDLRFLDRDALPGVREELRINGGHRVPVVVILSEDYEEVVRYGDRTLTTYRRMASEQLGAACPTGIIAPATESLLAVTEEWLAEFERAQLLLRLSPRLRSLHGD